MSIVTDFFLTDLKDTEPSHLLEQLASCLEQLAELSLSMRSHTAGVTLQKEPDGSINLSLTVLPNSLLNKESAPIL